MNTKLPSMPASIDDGGRSVFEWANALSAATEKAHKIRGIRRLILESSNTCGSCSKWMTRDCPRERNVNGQNRGPSMNAPKCVKFSMKDFDKTWIEKLETDLAELTKEDA